MKIVLAYSGGLDTSVMVRWLRERYAEAEIITVTGDLGQKREIEGVRAKALATGAARAYVKNLQEEFITGYAFPALMAGALYEGAYPMATSLGRPLLAKYLVDVARAEKAAMVAHGCTGKGNDQVRFEVSVAALAPDLVCLAPLREWEFTSREEEMAYAEKHGIPIAATRQSPYSIDENLWGTSVECGVLEDPMVEPPEDAYQRTVSPDHAPDEPAYVDLEFLEGIPVAMNGDPLSGAALVRAIDELAAAHGVGRIDLVENRLVGIKSREIYEAPAAVVLHAAHTELERLTLDKATFHLKSQLAAEYASMVYNGLWFSPLRLALDAFVRETQRYVSGTVRMKLLKGRATVAGRSSPHSLYQQTLATYTAEDTFDQTASAGFIAIYGLPVKTYHRVHQKPNGASQRRLQKAGAFVQS